MDEVMEARYIQAIIDGRSKEDLARIIIQKERAITDFCSFANEMLAGGSLGKMDDIADALEKMHCYIVAEELRGIKRYILNECMEQKKKNNRP